MTSASRFAVTAAMLILGAFAQSHHAQARSYPEYVKSACKQDFRKFCRPYGEESAALRQCMRRAAEDLSRRCQDALERSGERRGRR